MKVLSALLLFVAAIGIANDKPNIYNLQDLAMVIVFVGLVLAVGRIELPNITKENNDD